MGSIGEGSSKRNESIPGVRASDRDQESVGVHKVLLFLKSINEKWRMTILPELKYDEGVYGLTEDWNEVECGCATNMMRGGRQQHNPRAAEK